MGLIKMEDDQNGNFSAALRPVGIDRKRLGYTKASNTTPKLRGHLGPAKADVPLPKSGLIFRVVSNQGLGENRSGAGKLPLFGTSESRGAEARGFEEDGAHSSKQLQRIYTSHARQQSPEPPGGVYLAPRQFRCPEKNTWSSNASAPSARALFSQRQSPNEHEWITSASEKRVAFQMPQRAMHGRRRGGFTRPQKIRRAKPHSTGNQYNKKSHARRARRPGVNHRYALRRRYYMHSGGETGSVGGAAGGMMFGLNEDPFEDGEENDMLQMRFQESDSDDDEGDDGGSINEQIQDGPPPLENDDQAHVFFYYVGGGTEVDIVENYIAELEGASHELKCLSNERDFKTDLTTMQNIVLAVGLSQRTVLLCTQEFIDNDFDVLNIAADLVMTEEEKKLKVFVLLSQDADLPKALHKNKVFDLADENALCKLTKLLSSGPVPKELYYKTEPTAPPLDQAPDDVDATAPAADLPKELPLYQNGSIVKKVTADKYKEYEVVDLEAGRTACSCLGGCDVLCPRSEPQYEVPPQLCKRGLLIHPEEFEEIVQAVSDASRIKFFHKAVDCSLPCLYLCIILLTVAVVAPIWFLSVGAIKHHMPADEHSSSIFWSFFLCVIVAPTLVALAALALLMRIANEKYLKFRLKLEEFNKRFRETNLVLHCRKAFWYCSGHLKLFFIYYNFEECQQTLYYQVYESMKFNGNGSTCNSSSTGHTMIGTDINGNGHLPNGVDLSHSQGHGEFDGDIPTLKMDKILKRVNTLRKKYEWDYFEDLTTKKLPDTDERQHRKSGMCFCQYVLRRNLHDDPISWAELVKERCESTLRNAFRKSHVRRQLRKTPNVHANGISSGSNGHVRHSKPDIVYI